MIQHNCIFTLDYEIHGNGDGSPYKLMVEPTYRLMDLMEKYGAKLTILADVAEILCFKKYFDKCGVDAYNYQKIVLQLQEAVKRGHDVQLHIHSSYFLSEHDGKSWKQYWPEYNMAALSYDRIDEMIKLSKGFLESILKPVFADYSCHVFRAANWSMMPTPNIYKALVNNGIKIDTSVYKGGKQKGNVDFDYASAHSHLYPYNASSFDINIKDDEGLLMEYPIYTEMRYFWSFLTPIRLYRIIRAKFHKHELSEDAPKYSSQDLKKLSLQSFFVKSPWKLDFNQASGRQMINALKRIRCQTRKIGKSTDVVFIGHSKTFISYNEGTFELFLKWAKRQKDITFSLFK